MSSSLRALARPLIILSAVALGATLARADCECDPRPLDVCFVLDSTGSMTGAIDSCKKRITRILELLRENAPKVRMGIVTYRDHGDEYLRKGIELTDDFPRVVAFLKGLQANGGGDTPEAVEAGLEMAYGDSSMRWDPRAKKILVLVGDAPPHDNKKKLCVDMATDARKKGVVTFTLSVEGTVTAFKEIAAAGGGKNVDIQRADDVARHVLALTLDRDEQEFKDAFAEGPQDGSSTRQPAGGRTSGATRPRGPFVLQQLKYDGDWDPPHAHKRLLRALRERAGVECAPERHVVKATDEAIWKEPLLYVTGHGALKLSKDEEERLRQFVARGGTILFERCCDSEAFDQSARELGARLAGEPLELCGPEHPVFRSGGKIETLEHAREHGTNVYESRRPQLYEARSKEGRPLVLYSPVDLGCGWSGLEAGKSCALRERDALRWSVNVILYVLST